MPVTCNLEKAAIVMKCFESRRTVFNIKHKILNDLPMHVEILHYDSIVYSIACQLLIYKFCYNYDFEPAQLMSFKIKRNLNPGR